MKDLKNRQGFSFFYAGQDYVATEEWLIANGCLRLLSYVNEKTLILKRCKRGAKTFVDSGAFSAMNRNLEINVDDYIQFLNENHENLMMYCQWDYIPLDQKSAEECAKKTWDNYLYMKNKLKDSSKLVYCYHHMEDIKWLKQAIENGVRLIAIGGIAKKSKKIRYEFLSQVEEILEQYPDEDFIIHAFGMTGQDVLKRFDFITSADSSTWLYPSKFGEIETTICKKIYFGDDLNKKHHYKNQDLLTQMDIDLELEKYGFSAEEMTQRRNRSLYQAMFWKDKMLNLKTER